MVIVVDIEVIQEPVSAADILDFGSVTSTFKPEAITLNFRVNQEGCYHPHPRVSA
jgi:hypothetical protein